MRILLLMTALAVFAPYTFFAQNKNTKSAPQKKSAASKPKPAVQNEPAVNASLPEAEQKVVTGTVLLNDKTAPAAKTLLATLKSDWKLRIDSSSIAEKTLVFSTGTATVMIAFLDYPVAPDEIKAAARLSWLWKTSAEEAPRHQSQMVISVIGPGSRTLDLYKIFTKAAAAVLENTRSAGVYMGSQYLLLPKDFYTAAARNMLHEQSLPVYCWVYFGVMQDKGLSSGYTFGMQEFGLTEMEIVQSKNPLPEVHSVLYDAAASVLQYNTQLLDGQSVVTQGDMKVPVHLSKSAFLNGQTLKLDF